MKKLVLLLIAAPAFATSFEGPNACYRITKTDSEFPKAPDTLCINPIQEGGEKVEISITHGIVGLFEEEIAKFVVVEKSFETIGNFQVTTYGFRIPSFSNLNIVLSLNFLGTEGTASIGNIDYKIERL